MKESAPYNKEFVKFIPYLNKIDITTGTLIKRIEFIYNLCSDMCTDEIKDIFVEDYIKEDGTREYEALNFFSNGYCLSARNFISQIDLVIAPMAKRVCIWQVKAKDYDFKKASTKSRLIVEFKLFPEILCDLKAARGNCAYLQKIVNKYIKTNQLLL